MQASSDDQSTKQQPTGSHHNTMREPTRGCDSHVWVIHTAFIQHSYTKQFRMACRAGGAREIVLEAQHTQTMELSPGKSEYILRASSKDLAMAD